MARRRVLKSRRWRGTLEDFLIEMQPGHIIMHPETLAEIFDMLGGDGGELEGFTIRTSPLCPDGKVYGTPCTMNDLGLILADDDAR